MRLAHLPLLLLTFATTTLAAQPITPLDPSHLQQQSLLGDPRFQHGGQFNTIQFSPDGKQVFLAGETMTLWDLSSGKKLAQFDPIKFGVSWSRQIPGTTQCVYEFGTGPAMLKSDLVLADMQTGKELWRIHHDACLIGLTVTNDGKKIITGDDKGRIIFWDTTTAKELRRDQMAETPYRLDMSPDQKTLIWRDNKGFTGFVHMADDGGDPGIDILSLKLESKESLASFCASPDRSKVAFTTQTGGLILADNKTATITWKRNLPGSTALGLQFSPDGNTLAIDREIQSGGTLYLIRAATGDYLAQIKLPSATAARTFSPDGKEILLDVKGCLARFDIATGKQLFPAQADALSGFVSSIYPTADNSGFFLSNPGIGTVRWNLITNDRETIFAPTGRYFADGALSPDETRMIMSVGGTNDSIIVDLQSKTKIGDLLSQHNIDTGGTDNWVWSADGKLVASIDWQNQAVIFDAATQKRLRTGPEKNLHTLFPTADPAVALSYRSITIPATRDTRAATTTTFAFWDTSTGASLADFPIVGGENSGPAIPKAFGPNNRTMLMENGGKLYAYIAPPIKALTPTELATLKAQLPDLASPDFARREAATTAFVNAGPTADTILTTANLTDPEATQRIATIREQWRKTALTLTPLPDSLPAQDEDHPIKQVIIHPDGIHFALLRGTSWRGDTITLGEITPNGLKVTREIQNDNGPNSLAFSHNGQKLFVGNRNATITIYTPDGK